MSSTGFQQVWSYPELTGRNVIVTGAANGIGRATARLLAESGANVVLADLDLAGIGQLAAGWDSRWGGRCHAAALDLAEEASISAMVDQAMTALGSIDLLANVAGIFPMAPFAATEAAMLRKVLAINLEGAFTLCQAVVPHMPCGLVAARGRPFPAGSALGLRGIWRGAIIRGLSSPARKCGRGATVVQSPRQDASALTGAGRPD